MIASRKSENRVKNKNTFFYYAKHFFFFFKQKYIYFSLLENKFFKIPKNLIALAFFFSEVDTKKHRYASAKPSAFADCRGSFRTLKVHGQFCDNRYIWCVSKNK